ncbi:hypothetical protein DVK00_19110 [Haloarcula sp. Atlit-47R]|nr:hypothetical protein DVK00_19110 [Haloarcula sp. Atlit-47R]
MHDMNPMSDAPTGISPDEEDVEDLPDEILEPVAEGISRLTQRRRSLRPTIANLHARWLSDDPVQEELQELFRDIDEEGETIVALQILDNFDDHDALLSECQSRDYLSEEITDEAEVFLEEISWTFAASSAIVQASKGDYYWTNIVTGLAGENETGETLIGQRANHGVDEIWDIQVPLNAMLGQNLREIQEIIIQLRNLPPAVEFKEEELQNLEEFADALSTVAEQTEDAIEDITQTQSGADEFDPGDLDDFDPDDLLE